MPLRISHLAEGDPAQPGRSRSTRHQRGASWSSCCGIPPSMQFRGPPPRLHKRARWRAVCQGQRFLDEVFDFSLELGRL